MRETPSAARRQRSALAALVALAFVAACASPSGVPGRRSRPATIDFVPAEPDAKEAPRQTTRSSPSAAPAPPPADEPQPAPPRSYDAAPEPMDDAEAVILTEETSESSSWTSWLPWNWKGSPNEEPAPTPAYTPPPTPLAGPPPAKPFLVEPEKPVDLANLGVLAKRDEPAGMQFQHFGVNPTVSTSEERFSTFSVDTDTASYAMTRSHLERSVLPPEASVRVEEFVNAFDYGYRAPKDAFAVSAEAFPSPHRKGYHVLHVGLKARTLTPEERAPAQLVFVVDTSGSMGDLGKLDLLKRSLRLLARELGPSDSVAIVSFADTATLVLPPTPASSTRAITEAVEELQVTGGTNVEAGLREGYRVASGLLRRGVTTRVILCSDGVANSGLTEASGIFETIRVAVSEGVWLTTVGVGRSSYNDVLLEKLAQVGNGRYVYFDNFSDADRVFRTELAGTIQVAAKDVKIQVEFDPAAVSRYRLLGYENRGMAAKDFRNDRVDAGEIGLGHAVTALYEVKVANAGIPLGALHLRWKEPETNAVRELDKPLTPDLVRARMEVASPPARLSFVVAEFAEKLRGSYWVRTLEWEELRDMWLALGADLLELKQVRELGDLIDTARRLDGRGDRFETRFPIANMDFDRIPVLE